MTHDVLSAAWFKMLCRRKKSVCVTCTSIMLMCSLPSFWNCQQIDSLAMGVLSVLGGWEGAHTAAAHLVGACHPCTASPLGLQVAILC